VIRKAEAKDAAAFCYVIRTSVIELCKLDHHDNRDRLAEWLGNKTVENCEEWIRDTHSNSFVAEDKDKVVGIAHIGHNGYLFLCYVLPEVKGLGFGGQLLNAVETSLKHLGVQFINLESTLTAKRFYEHYGYLNVGKTQHCLQYSKAINPR